MNVTVWLHGRAGEQLRLKVGGRAYRLVLEVRHGQLAGHGVVVARFRDELRVGVFGGGEKHGKVLHAAAAPPDGQQGALWLDTQWIMFELGGLLDTFS